MNTNIWRKNSARFFIISEFPCEFWKGQGNDRFKPKSAQVDRHFAGHAYTQKVTAMHTHCRQTHTLTGWPDESVVP